MLAALISSLGVRIVNVPDPPPRELSVPETTTVQRYTHWIEDPLTIPAYRTRRFVRQDDHSYIERESIGSIRR